MDHVAIDLGGRESQICIRGPDNQVLLEKRLPTDKLDAFFRERQPCRVILETCAEAFAVAVQAKAAGHDVRVVPATLVRALGVGQRGIKTDVRDARCLSEASVRMDLGSVHVPSALSREMKAVCSLRDALVRTRTQLINSVRGWMRGQLRRVEKGSTATFPRRVRALYAALTEEVPPYVERQLCAIEGVEDQISASDDELELLARSSPECRRLMTIPGVGPATAVRFVSAIDEVSRFKTAHEVESYFGLTPGEQSSSDSKHRTGITKAGAPAVRWLLVQAAWAAWRTRPNDPLLLWARSLFGRKKNKLVAIAALARKMAGIMFALLRDKTEYEPERASTVRASSGNAVVVAAGAEATKIARAATPAVAPPTSAPRPTSPPPTEALAGPPLRGVTAPKKQRRSAEAPKKRRSAGWGEKSEEPRPSPRVKRAPSPRERPPRAD